MKKAKRDPLRTEAAIKRAVGAWNQGDARIKDYEHDNQLPEEFEMFFIDSYSREIIAVADLRDLYRKRKPLKGVTKKLRRAVR